MAEHASKRACGGWGGRRLTVEMVGAADVVPGDDGDEGSSAVGTGRLHTTKCVGVQSGGRAVAVAFSLHTGVDTCGVTSPHLDVGIGDGLAG